MNKVTLVVNTIKFIASKRVFLINNKIWLNATDVQILFSNMGLSTRTSFMKLRGCTLSFYMTTAPEDTTDTNPHIVTSKVTEREIKFTKPGDKRIDWDIEMLSPSLESQFNTSALGFADWGNSPAEEE